MTTTARDQQEAQLCRRAQQGDSRAAEELVGRLRFLAVAASRRFFFRCGDYDDVLAEALYGLAQGVRDWRRGRGLTVRAFVGMVIARHLVLCVRARRYRRDYALLAEMSPRDRLEEHTWEREVSCGGESPLATVLACERALEAQCIFETSKLSPLERAAFAGVACGLSYEAVAEQLTERGQPTGVKSVDNALCRAKSKIERTVDALEARETARITGGDSNQQREGEAWTAF